jgi:hypothetical protein
MIEARFVSVQDVRCFARIEAASPSLDDGLRYETNELSSSGASSPAEIMI